VSGLTASGGGTASTGPASRGTTVTVTTGSTPHNYLAGQTVTIANVALRVTTVCSRSPGSRPDEFHLHGRVRIDGFGRRHRIDRGQRVEHYGDGHHRFDPAQLRGGQTVTIANVGLAGYNGLFQIVSVRPDEFHLHGRVRIDGFGRRHRIDRASESNTTVTVTPVRPSTATRLVKR